MASVKTNDSMVAISGAIIPEPLAIPTIETWVFPIFNLRIAAFGKVSVVIMAAAASAHFVLPRRLATSDSFARDIILRDRNADDTSRGDVNLVAPAAETLGRRRHRMLDGLVAGMAGEGVGIAGIHDQAADAAIFQDRTTPVHRCRRAFRLGEDAGNSRPFCELRKEQIRPATFFKPAAIPDTRTPATGANAGNRAGASGDLLNMIDLFIGFLLSAVGAGKGCPSSVNRSNFGPIARRIQNIDSNASAKSRAIWGERVERRYRTFSSIFYLDHMPAELSLDGRFGHRARFIAKAVRERFYHVAFNENIRDHRRATQQGLWNGSLATSSNGLSAGSSSIPP